MKRCHRMKRSADFARLRREGQSRAGRFLVVSTLQCSDIKAQPSFLVGIITSRKVGIAVIRNRARRRLRALVDEFAERIVPGSMIVIIARYTSAKADYNDLRRDWERLGVKAGIFTPQPA